MQANKVIVLHTQSIILMLYGQSYRILPIESGVKAEFKPWEK